MIDHLLTRAQHRASHAAGTAAIGLGAGLLLCIGLGFWTAAGWMFLLTVTTALNAALIMGAVFTGAAMIGFAVVALRGRHVRRAPHASPTPPPQVGLDSLVGAFISGMTAGTKARSPRH